MKQGIINDWHEKCKKRNKNDVYGTVIEDICGFAEKRFKELSEENKNGKVKKKEIEEEVEEYIVKRIEFWLNYKEYEKAKYVYFLGKSFFEALEYEKEKESKRSYYDSKNNYINRSLKFGEIMVGAIKKCVSDTEKLQKLLSMLNKNAYGVVIINSSAKDEEFKSELIKAIESDIEAGEADRVNILGKIEDWGETDKDVFSKKLSKLVEKGESEKARNMLNDNKNMFNQERLKFYLIEAVGTAIEEGNVNKVNILEGSKIWQDEDEDMFVKKIIELVEQGKGDKVIKVLDDSKKMLNEENLREAVLENVEYYKKFDKGEEIIEEKINRLEDFLGKCELKNININKLENQKNRQARGEGQLLDDINNRYDDFAPQKNSKAKFSKIDKEENSPNKSSIGRDK